MAIIRKSANSELNNLILELAANPTGVSALDSVFQSFETRQVYSAIQYMVKHETLIKVKVSFKNVKYFTDKVMADAISAKIRTVIKGSTKKHSKFSEGEMIITANTKFTSCPNFSPRNQEIVLPHIFSNLQRGRVCR